MQKIERNFVSDPAARTAGMYTIQSTGFRQPSPFWQYVDTQMMNNALPNAARGANQLADAVAMLDDEADAVAIGKLRQDMQAARNQGEYDLIQNQPNDDLYNSIPSRVEDYKAKMTSQLDALPLSKRGKDFMSKEIEIKSAEVQSAYELAFLRKKADWTNKGVNNFLNESAAAGNVELTNQWYDKAESLGLQPEKSREAMTSYAASRAMMTQYEQMNLPQLRNFIQTSQAKLSETGDNSIKIGENTLLREDLRGVIKEAKGRERGMISDNMDAYNRLYVNGGLTMAGIQSDYDIGQVDEKTFKTMESYLQHDQYSMFYADLKKNIGDESWRKNAVSQIETARAANEISLDQSSNLLEAVKSGNLAALRQAEDERRQKASDAVADYKLRQLDFDWSNDVKTRQQQYLDERLQINQDQYMSRKDKESLLTDLKKDFESNQKYKDNPVFKNSEDYLDILEAQGKFYNSGNKTPETKSAVKNSLRINLRDYMRANPNATDAEVQSYINDNVKIYNATKLDNMASEAFKLSGQIPAVQQFKAPAGVISASGQSQGNEIKRKFGDKFLIYDAITHKPIRWE